MPPRLREATLITSAGRARRSANFLAPIVRARPGKTCAYHEARPGGPRIAAGGGEAHCEVRRRSGGLEAYSISPERLEAACWPPVIQFSRTVPVPSPRARRRHGVPVPQDDEIALPQIPDRNLGLPRCRDPPRRGRG